MIVLTCGHIATENDGEDGMGICVAIKSQTKEGDSAISYETVCKDCEKKYKNYGLIVDNVNKFFKIEQSCKTKISKCFDTHAWRNGECCCNCEFQLELLTHPWNKVFGKGIGEICGYVCIAENVIYSDYKSTFFDINLKHGFCELYKRREK